MRNAYSEQRGENGGAACGLSTTLTQVGDSSSSESLEYSDLLKTQRASELPPKLAASSISLRLALTNLGKVADKLCELSLIHTVQSHANNIKILLRQFSVQPSVETWRAIGDTIGTLTECYPVESDDLLKQYELLSQYHHHFFDLEQKDTNTQYLIDCYKGYIPSSSPSPDIACSPCLVHSVISKTFMACSNYLSSITNDHLKALNIESLIEDKQKSDFYRLLCGDNSFTKGFSMSLDDTQIQDKCVITMKWLLPSELFEDVLAHDAKLSRTIRELNSALNCLDINLDETYRGRHLVVDISFPSVSLEHPEILTPHAPTKIDLMKDLQFTFNGIFVSTTQDVFKANLENIGDAIQITQSFQRRFSNSTSRLYFFIPPNQQEPFLQLNCPPLKMSLPLKTFCKPDAFTSNEVYEVDLKTLEREPMQISFSRALHNLDNIVTIKELTLGFNTLSSETNSISLIEALSTFVNAAKKMFPNVRLILNCGRDKTGDVFARIDFDGDELYPNSDTSPFIPGHATYDKRGFFRGVLETNNTAKRLEKILREFPLSDSISEIAKKLNPKDATKIHLPAEEPSSPTKEQGGLQLPKSDKNRPSISFDSEFLSSCGNLTNADLIYLILTNSVEWCSNENKYCIGLGKAFIPDSWYL